ncbi:MAG: hypothetical protein GX558_03905 [Clostridiales bacterium]|nr:hypothetical protein [Clostridiales bacterium]
MLAALVLTLALAVPAWASAGAPAPVESAPSAETPPATASAAPLPTPTPTPSPTPIPTPTPTPSPTPAPSPTAAPDGVTVSISASPDSLVVPGSVEVRLRLQNKGGSAADALYLLSPSGATLAGPLSLAPGATDTWRGSVAVSQSELDAGQVRLKLRYMLAAGEPGEHSIERDVSMAVRRLAARPALEFTRELSSSYVEYGQQLTVTYRLKNAGNVRLTGVVVTDELFGGVVERVGALDVGKKRTITRRITVKRRLVSKAVATCGYVGGDGTLRVSRGSATVHLADVQLDLQLDADKSTVASGELVTLRLKLVNNGNVPFSQLHVEDAVFGDLGWLDGRLEPGESYTVTKAVQLKSTTTFQFSVSCACATGAQVNLQSNERTVFVQPAASDVRLRIEAEADRTRLDAPGEVTFTLHVYNDGGIELRNVQLLEMRRGTIRSLLFLPAGETPPLEQTYAVDESATFQFIARTADAAGEDISAISQPIEIEVRSPEVVPTLPPVPPAPAGPAALSRGRVVAALALATGLMVALTALLLVGMARDFRARRARRRGR